jgi:hypothetical protein
MTFNAETIKAVTHQSLKLTTLICCAIFSLWTTSAAAGSLTVHLGPPGLGNGGSNPVSIPPINPLDYEVTYLTDSNYEWNIALSPGLTFGKRETLATEIYASIGAGLILDFNGAGPGVYSSVGWNAGTDNQPVRFNLEFKQALAIASGRIISPYAFRIGATFDL